MASDLLLGWLLGMATIGGPLIYLKFREMKAHIDFLAHGENRNVPVEEFPNRRENS